MNRYKLAFDSFRAPISIHQPIPSASTSSSSLISSPPKKSNLEILSRRYYYIDRNQVHHFKPRGPQTWLRNKTHILIAGLGTGVLSTVYFTHLETVPYTKRSHFVLLSAAMEQQMGELEFKNVKKMFKGRILPGLHPESVRVRLIAKRVIEALQRGLKQGSGVKVGEGLGEDVGRERLGGEEGEVLDDSWVHKCRKRALERGVRAATKHLNGLHWEVVLVDEPAVNAFCLPGGKIVVFTGLLLHFRTDDEVAAIIGHEVAHAVARHSAEGITKNMMEIEADYIGLLLIASAGYDPRIAPRVYEKLGELGGESPLRDYLSTHPSGKKRARLLAQAQVMEEALTIYREVKAGRLVQDFL